MEKCNTESAQVNETHVSAVKGQKHQKNKSLYQIFIMGKLTTKYTYQCNSISAQQIQVKQNMNVHQ
jgi:hypothetical protein